jgi:DNA-binding winged helix-turn-helix (wHTH) protein
MSTKVSDERLDAPRYQFDEFVLDVPDRQLWRGDTRVDLNARYLDALVLLVRERGQLVDKERFFDEVWSDVVVSDSALTQCIKEIRKQLGDDASNPRYIQTVPRHSYRFIGTVDPLPTDQPDSEIPPHATDTGASQVAAAASPRREAEPIWREGLQEWGAGTLGGGLAGLLGGLLYGYGLASADAGVGTLSTLLVLVSLNVLVGLTGGFGVSFGLAGAGVAARFWPTMRVVLRVAGAALGGLFVGALAKLLGVDAFNLLFGRAPAGITGGPEGAVLGAALALGAHLGHYVGARRGDAARWHAAVGAGGAGAIAGALIPLAGGRLMGGSLDLLAQSFANSRLRLDTFGSFFGELHFGHLTQVILGSVEGLLFGSCVVGAIVAVRHLGQRKQVK